MGTPAALRPVGLGRTPDQSGSGNSEKLNRIPVEPKPIAAKTSRQGTREQRLAGLVNNLSSSLSHFGWRVKGFAESCPFHFLITVAGVSFVAGVGLRIWRSSRYE